MGNEHRYFLLPRKGLITEMSLGVSRLNLLDRNFRNRYLLPGNEDQTSA